MLFWWKQSSLYLTLFIPSKLSVVPNTRKSTSFLIIQYFQPVKPDVTDQLLSALAAGRPAWCLAPAACSDVAVWVLVAVPWQFGIILLELKQQENRQTALSCPFCLSFLPRKLLPFAWGYLCWQKLLYFKDAFRCFFLFVASCGMVTVKRGSCSLGELTY